MKNRDCCFLWKLLLSALRPQHFTGRGHQFVLYPKYTVLLSLCTNCSYYGAEKNLRAQFSISERHNIYVSEQFEVLVNYVTVKLLPWKGNKLLFPSQMDRECLLCSRPALAAAGRARSQTHVGCSITELAIQQITGK